ncbi:hypothetical protein [Aeromicrobium sp. CTD01-1L150]|uniref:hypothetical protein n=1 Tax=Aeromicrobium sp. CTD01-1L150 TaxID=3341830 RepID=UPI0035C22817
MSEMLTVMVVSDPGLPSRRVAHVRDQLERDVQEWCGRPVTVEMRQRQLRLTPQNSLELDEIAHVTEELELGADTVLVVTEIPRHSQGKPLVAELRPDIGAAILSLPTLGVVRTRARLRRLMLACIARSVPVAPGRDVADLDRRWAHWGDTVHGQTCALLASTWTAAPRIVAGMTAANEPLRVALRLSSALAAAAAVGAFGIFYHSIWQMASALSVLRLAVIAVAAVVAMTLWLLLSNRLWDRARLEPMRRIVALYNVSTVLTLVVCVVALYAVLSVLILVGSALVIDPDFMASVLGQKASWADYAAVAWLSAAMGVVAGALGSSFDSDTEVRDLTHGQRERQRFQQHTED